MKKIFTVFILTALLYTADSYGQLKILLGPTVGISIPSGDYAGNTIDFYSGTKYGQGSGATLGGSAKLKVPFLSLKGGLMYTIFKNSGYYEQGKGNIDIKHNVITVSAGPEFSFGIPFTSVTPFIGAELMFSFFRGETSFKDVAKVPTGTFDLNSAVRTGVSFSAGAEFDIDNYVIGLEARYSLHNLLGTKFTSVSNPERLDSYLSLNDKKDPLYNGIDDKHPIGKDRMISSFSITASILFKLGI